VLLFELGHRQNGPSAKQQLHGVRCRLRAIPLLYIIKYYAGFCWIPYTVKFGCLNFTEARDSEYHIPSMLIPSVLWRCWLGGRKGIRPVKSEWWIAGMVICLERGADLRMAQLMLLPLTVSWFSKIQIGFTFLVPAHLGSPGKKAVKRVSVKRQWVAMASAGAYASLHLAPDR